MAHDFDQWLALASHVGVAGAYASPICPVVQMTPRQRARHEHAQRVQAAKQRRLTVSRSAEVGFTTDKEVDAFNESVHQLRTDITNAIGAAQPLTHSVNILVADWEKWLKDSEGVVSQLLVPRPVFGDEAMMTFKLRYADIYSAFANIGGKTTAIKIGPGSKAGGSGFSIPWWIWPVGLAALAIVFVGPAVVPILLTKKAAGAALAVV